MSEVLTNARIVLPDGVLEGSVEFEGGVISALGEGTSAVGQDCDGDWLIPGVIDIHTDNLERHYFPRPNIDWNPVSAAIVHDGLCISVGVTTVFDSLSLGSFGYGAARTPDNLIRLTNGLQFAWEHQLLKADHRIHWRCETPSEVLELEVDRLSSNPMTGLFSLMDHTPGQRQYRNLEKFLVMWRQEGASDSEIERRLAAQKERQALNADKGRRLVADIAKSRGLPLASHDDETEAHSDQAADLGATISEFPVTVEAARRAHERGMAVVMGGPNLIRGGSYSGNVPAATLANEGLLDGFASDYVPRSLIECAFRLADEPFGWSISKAVDTVTGVPARACGLTDRGAIRLGARADLVRVRVSQGQVLVKGVWVKGQRVG
jgi:alpha-D-ribose 1-methylphosphonate 5-triphosphate diphosphatase